MSDDSTLGGYLEVHERAPAFEGSDGCAYSAAVFADDEPDASGRYGGAVLFVRWSPAGDRPIGHLESAYVCFGATPEEAAAGVHALSLHDVKEHLERAIVADRDRDLW
jgi:hypothetical protein